MVVLVTLTLKEREAGVEEREARLGTREAEVEGREGEVGVGEEALRKEDRSVIEGRTEGERAWHEEHWERDVFGREKDVEGAEDRPIDQYINVLNTYVFNFVVLMT